MTPSNPFDDESPPIELIENTPNDPHQEESTKRSPFDDPTSRARRRREEAISRLVADATRPPPNRDDAQHDSSLLLASTIASSIERGLDRELHSELIRQGKDATEKIGKICHDYSEEFLESVGRVVVALGGPCEELRGSLEEVCWNLLGG
jgi:hypothetical protein